VEPPDISGATNDVDEIDVEVSDVVILVVEYNADS